jgi:hypothetical protein
MRESGLIGIISIVFRTVRDGYGTARAWQVIAVFASVPLLLLALILLLIL